jgi:hypothetical protein
MIKLEIFQTLHTLMREGKGIAQLNAARTLLEMANTHVTAGPQTTVVEWEIIDAEGAE